MVMRAFLAGRSISTRETAAFLSLALSSSRTLMSSASMPAKSRLLAYQRLAQLRLTERRKPVGWIFCPIVFPGLFLVAHRHVHMARGLDQARAAALGASGRALERRALLDVDGLDTQLVDVGAVVVLGVGDRGLQHLAHDRRGLLLREVENVQSLVHFLAADQVGDEAPLVDRQAHASQDCTGFGC